MNHEYLEVSVGKILHILNLRFSCITLRELCINQQPRCDIAGLHVSNIYTTVSRVKRLSNFVLNKLFKTIKCSVKPESIVIKCSVKPESIVIKCSVKPESIVNVFYRV
jgi:hypothetical protein